MIAQRRDEDAGDDGHGPAQARSQDQAQQLGFIAQFADGDRGGRDQERFQAATRPGPAAPRSRSRSCRRHDPRTKW